MVLWPDFCIDFANNQHRVEKSVLKSQLKSQNGQFLVILSMIHHIILRAIFVVPYFCITFNHIRPLLNYHYITLKTTLTMENISRTPTS